MKNILVIFGGKSVEHDISIITAMQVLSNLPTGYNFIPVYIDKDQHWWLGDNLDRAETFIDFHKKVKNKHACSLVAGSSMLCEVSHGKFKKMRYIHCAVLCCHGGNGEAGALQGLLDLCKIPYTSPSFAQSSVCMDKVLTKLVLDDKEIKNIDFINFYYEDFKENKTFYIDKCERNIGYPLIVKPARLGSSVGIHICSNREELFNAIEIAKEYDGKILIEEYLKDCKEFCCACLNINDNLFVSSVNEVSKSEIFTFEEKYLSNKPKSKKVNKSIEEEIKKLTSKVYETLECKGIVRVDFLYSPKDMQLYVCEVNTIPGSLSFNLFDNIKFSDLLRNLIETSIEDYNKQKGLIYNFNSDAIKHYISLSKINKFTK